jgi:hypothetical protein
VVVWILLEVNEKSSFGSCVALFMFSVSSSFFPSLVV